MPLGVGANNEKGCRHLGRTQGVQNERGVNRIGTVIECQGDLVVGRTATGNHVGRWVSGEVRGRDQATLRVEFDHPAANLRLRGDVQDFTLAFVV